MRTSKETATGINSGENECVENITAVSNIRSLSTLFNTWKTLPECLIPDSLEPIANRSPRDVRSSRHCR